MPKGAAVFFWASFAWIAAVSAGTFELPKVHANASFASMGRRLALAALVLIGARADGRTGAPIYDPVMLNIGINCQWQQSCELRQLRAMASTHRLMATTRQPVWRVHLCNRNAARSPVRIDWVGFNNCIRNTHLRPSRRYRR